MLLALLGLARLAHAAGLEAPPALDLGWIQAGATVQAALTLKNPGKEPVIIRGARFEGVSGFSLMPDPAGLAVGRRGSLDLTVSFTPPRPTEEEGALRLDTSAGELVIPVSGAAFDRDEGQPAWTLGALGEDGTMGFGGLIGAEGTTAGEAGLGGLGRGELPRAEPRDALIVGSAAPSSVVDAFRARAGDVRACYGAALAVDPALVGEIQVELALDDQGRAASVRVLSGSPAAASLGACLTGALKGAGLSLPGPAVHAFSLSPR